jgi:D-alanyl-D-alanine carboxypeptidase
MRARDRFRAGSIMKPFVSVVTLQLVECGWVSLDASLPEVLPAEVVDRFPTAPDITVRMLLNHRSGIAEWDLPEQDEYAARHPGHVWTIAEILDIVRPLRLMHTTLPAPGNLSIEGPHAHGYFELDGRLVDLTRLDPSLAGAAGGGALVTTVQDLARFWDALLKGRLFRHPDTLKRMLSFSPTPGEVTSGYGLGVEQYTTPGGLARTHRAPRWRRELPSVHRSPAAPRRHHRVRVELSRRPLATDLPGGHDDRSTDGRL